MCFHHFFSLSSHRESTHVPADQTQTPDVRKELIMLSLPALAGQAIDPLAQLMETAYIGRLGMASLSLHYSCTSLLRIPVFFSF